MIYGGVIGRIEPGQLALVEPGTLDVRPCKEGETPAFMATVGFDIGQTVMLGPQLDHRLVDQNFGQVVAK